MVSGAAPGTIRRLDCAAGEVVPGVGRRVLARVWVGAGDRAGAGVGVLLPPVCLVYAVEAAAFAPGAEMTAVVAEAAEAAAGRIAVELAALFPRYGPACPGHL